MTVRYIVGDAREALRELPDESVHCVVTSPPYWGLRAYGGDPGMIGLEPTFDDHLDNLLAVFREVRRVLRKDGTLWLNYGDAYTAGGQGGHKTSTTFHGHDPAREKPPGPTRAPAGYKPKDLLMMPARVAMALQADGWWLRSEIVWHKPNPMAESVTDRPTSAHEKMFLLSKSARYFYDGDAVRRPMQPSTVARLSQATFDRQTGGPKDLKSVNRSHRKAMENLRERQLAGTLGVNLRNVWRIPTVPNREAHFASFPPALVEPCVKAGCPGDGVVLDPFAGIGTVGLVADRLGRDAILVEISDYYTAMARQRIASARLRGEA